MITIETMPFKPECMPQLGRYHRFSFSKFMEVYFYDPAA